MHPRHHPRHSCYRSRGSARRSIRDRVTVAPLTFMLILVSDPPGATSAAAATAGPARTWRFFEVAALVRPARPPLRSLCPSVNRLTDRSLAPSLGAAPFALAPRICSALCSWRGAYFAWVTRALCVCARVCVRVCADEGTLVGALFLPQRHPARPTTLRPLPSPAGPAVARSRGH